MNSADVSTEAKQIANIPICLLIICNTYYRVHLKKKKKSHLSFHLVKILPHIMVYQCHYAIALVLLWNVQKSIPIRREMERLI